MTPPGARPAGTAAARLAKFKDRFSFPTQLPPVPKWSNADKCYPSGNTSKCCPMLPANAQRKQHATPPAKAKPAKPAMPTPSPKKAPPPTKSAPPARPAGKKGPPPKRTAPPKRGPPPKRSAPPSRSSISQPAGQKPQPPKPQPAAARHAPTKKAPAAAKRPPPTKKSGPPPAKPSSSNGGDIDAQIAAKKAQLDAAMKSMQFEKCVQLRDQIAALEKLKAAQGSAKPKAVAFDKTTFDKGLALVETKMGEAMAAQKFEQCIQFRDFKTKFEGLQSSFASSPKKAAVNKEVAELFKKLSVT